MNTHCELCKRKFWQDGCESLAADSRYCTDCAVKACEQLQDKDAENEKLKQRVKNLEAFMWAVAAEVKCLPDFFDSLPDKGNSHIIQNLKAKDAKIARLMDVLKLIEENGGRGVIGVSCNGTWCAEQARRAREGGK